MIIAIFDPEAIKLDIREIGVVLCWETIIVLEEKMLEPVMDLFDPQDTGRAVLIGLDTAPPIIEEKGNNGRITLFDLRRDIILM